MKNEQTLSQRTRVNFSVSVKGIVTPEITFEGYDMDEKEVLAKASKLLDLAMKEANKRSAEVN
ncbi:MAG: hypothetical protein AABY22_36515 [Nanoarchaeota archaeon]